LGGKRTRKKRKGKNIKIKILANEEKATWRGADRRGIGTNKQETCSQGRR
jgi:hypothetical protein